MIATLIAAIQDNAHRITTGAAGLGGGGWIASKLGVINDCLGAIAAIVAIVCTILVTIWKKRSIDNEDKRDK